MDWPTVAALLVERSDTPLVLLDAGGRVRLFNGAFARLLGWARQEIDGRSWIDLCVAPSQAAASGAWLKRAMTGAVRECECEVHASDGRRLLLTLELSLVGGSREPALLLAVRSFAVLRDGAASLGHGDVDYEIASSGPAFGRLQRLVGLGHETPAYAPGARCFEVLTREHSPCADCPVRRLAEGSPQTVVRRRPERPASFEVVTAMPLDDASARVSVRVVSTLALAAIQKARIDAMAERGRLTPRERDVLEHLLVGRSLDDIASLLTLTRRTVKFHVGNVLQKLGADSRADLVRLVGF